MLPSKKLSNQPFPGFPDKSPLTPLPDLFFTALLPQISSLAELKLVLHAFWLLYQKPEPLKYITYKELVTNKALMEGMGGAGGSTEPLRDALESAVNHGILLHLVLDREEESQNLYFINTESNRRVVTKLQSGELSLGDALLQEKLYLKEEEPNIFALYEQNIGLLTPMIAEELKEAEKLYPASWIEEAFKEAVSLNKRSWRYIARILERWSSEGKESGEFRRDFKKEKGPSRYLKGRYGHLVKR